jgi:hypothetical protein
MVAYVVDLDEAHWRREIAARLLDRLGPQRLRSIEVQRASIALSGHEFVMVAPPTRRYRTEVAHFVLEIDARPRRR